MLLDTIILQVVTPFVTSYSADTQAGGERMICFAVSVL